MKIIYYLYIFVFVFGICESENASTSTIWFMKSLQIKYILYI